MILGPWTRSGKGVLNVVGIILLVLIALEASLFGSGRLLQVGPLTVKMYLFVAAEIYVIIRLVTFESLKLSTYMITLSLSLILCLGATVGIIYNSSLGAIAEDIKPLLYFFILCFVEMTMKTAEHLQLVVKIVKFSAVFISISYISILALFFTGVINFGTLYDLLSGGSEGEFLFRGDSGLFFYKGSLYVAVGLILFAFGRAWLSTLASVICFIGLVATGTRGFFLALMAVVLLHALTGIGGYVRRLRYFFAPCAGAAMFFILISGSLFGKEDSDAVRIVTAHQVADRVTALSTIVGNGLGVGVEEKPVHMENSYLEIFHKQGALGLLWWGSVLTLLFVRYRKARRINYSRAQPLFLAAMFVAIESVTNPFINNPIGIFVVIIALTGLDVVSAGLSPAPLPEQRGQAAN